MPLASAAAAPATAATPAPAAGFDLPTILAAPPALPGLVLGWDIGGAHVKAAVLRDGRLLDAAQWPCPLWQGLDELQAVLDQARARWPQWLAAPAAAQHAITMSGEMADGFADRAAGVAAIAGLLAHTLPAPAVFAGADADGRPQWCSSAAAAAHWPQIASANWLATALHTAQALAPAAGVLVDIGSTTTDFVPFAGGRVLARGRSDDQRLRGHELVYLGLVRTPLCALARRIPWRGQPHNVMNEFFATTADVFRLTGELDAAHDQHPSADHQPKTLAHTRARLARMVGLDARDGSEADWLAFAGQWRAAWLDTLAEELQALLADHGAALAGAGPLQWVAAGCGGGLLPALLARCGLPATGTAAPGPARPLRHWGPDLVPLDAQAPAGTADWASVCAPAVATAALWAARQPAQGMLR